MKIGIMTFHWATNYGAVLQAYSLQQYLIRQGADVEIINYRPSLVVTKQRLRAMKRFDKAFFQKEKSLERFRKTSLVQTQKKYSSMRSLLQCREMFDCIIVGSDQIWNESFTLRGEGKPTLSYFLDFVDYKTKRVAYAASFGFHTPSQAYISLVEDKIKMFDAISVREEDGLDIISTLGVSGELVCDPTILLERDDYMRLISPRCKEDAQLVFSYVLGANADAKKTSEYVGEKLLSRPQNNTFSGTLEEWLSSIYYSSIVVTDSFHGIVLSIILNTPFIAFMRKESGMNSRINSLLSRLGLESRILDHFSKDRIDSLMCEKIEWQRINEKLCSFRRISIEFIDAKILGKTKNYL